MSNLPVLTDEQRADLAVLYVLGDLTDAERAVVDARITAGDTQLAEEIAALEATAGELSLDAEPVEPPTELRRSALAKAGPQRPGVLLEEAGLRIESASRMDWKPGPLPGMEIKVLDIDREHGYSTQLVKFETGACYPGHKHAGIEELLILEGEIEVHGVPMGPGDYCRAEPGTTHKPATIGEPVLALVRTSIHDEVDLSTIPNA